MRYRKQFFYLGKKIVVFLCSLLVQSVLVFTISRLTPTDPLQSYYGERVEKMSVEEKEAARDRLGLNDSVPVQYMRWIQNAFRGDFGISYKYWQPGDTGGAGQNWKYDHSWWYWICAHICRSIIVGTFLCSKRKQSI